LEEALLSVIRMGGAKSAAVRHVGAVHERQVYRWLDTNARFRHAVELAEAEAELRFTRRRRLRARPTTATGERP
jgi:hypothetical protein